MSTFLFVQIDLLILHRLQGIGLFGARSFATGNNNYYVKTLVVDYTLGDYLQWEPYMDANGTMQQVCEL